jgi:hypothetical protein
MLKSRKNLRATFNFHFNPQISTDLHEVSSDGCDCISECICHAEAGENVHMWHIGPDPTFESKYAKYLDDFKVDDRAVKHHSHKLWSQTDCFFKTARNAKKHERKDWYKERIESDSHRDLHDVNRFGCVLDKAEKGWFLQKVNPKLDSTSYEPQTMIVNGDTYNFNRYDEIQCTYPCHDPTCDCEFYYTGELDSDYEYRDDWGDGIGKYFEDIDWEETL